jgi:hypothetical protein
MSAAMSEQAHRYLRVLVMLKREGWEIGKKRVYRLYRLEGLQRDFEASGPNQKWVSCKTTCTNGECMSVFGNGRVVKWTASWVYLPLERRSGFKTDGCGGFVDHINAAHATGGANSGICLHSLSTDGGQEGDFKRGCNQHADIFRG